MKQYTLGIDIGGTKCAVVLGGTQISHKHKEDFILDKQIFPTRTQLGPEHTISCLFEAIDQILQRNHITAAALTGIGVSCGGPLNHRTGVICDPPNLYGWNNVPIVRLLTDRYHVPAYLQNDANACALAEWKFGAAQGCSNIVFLTFGTGMGAGLILNGQLYCGASDMAGEVGHIRIADNGPVGFGKIGSFEGFCSGSGIAQLAKAMAMEAPVSYTHLMGLIRVTAAGSGSCNSFRRSSNARARFAPADSPAKMRSSACQPSLSSP